MEWIRRTAADGGRDGDQLRFVWRLDLGTPDEAMVRVHRTLRSEREFRADSAPTAGEAADAVGRYAEAGIADLELNFGWRDPKEFVDRLGWFADEVIPQLPASGGATAIDHSAGRMALAK